MSHSASHGKRPVHEIGATRDARGAHGAPWRASAGEWLRRRCRQGSTPAARAGTGGAEAAGDGARLVASAAPARRSSPRGPLAVPIVVEEEEAPALRLDAFVAGEENRLAHRIAIDVATAPSSIYSPLYLYGAAGLGKTHLLRGVHARFREAQRGRGAIYATGEQFARQFAASLHARSLVDFRMRYRRCDLLVLDDVQLLAGKRATQEELLHTFNDLTLDGRRVVLAADRPPRELTDLLPTLVARFLSGAVIRLHPPGAATRLALLASRAAATHLEFPVEVLHHLAHHGPSGPRELIGALTKLAALAQLTGAPLTVPLARAVLDDGTRRPKDRPPTLDEVAERVAEQFHIDVEGVRSRSRRLSSVVPRQVAMALAKECTGRSLAEVGSFFGGRSGTTVAHACRSVEARAAKDPTLRDALGAARARLVPSP